MIFVYTPFSQDKLYPARQKDGGAYRSPQSVIIMVVAADGIEYARTVYYLNGVTGLLASFPWEEDLL